MPKEEKKEVCCKSVFPTFAVIVLVLAVLWLFGDMGLLGVNIPWLPVILIIVAIGWIINNYKKK
ncbi:hypothetical protein KY345_00650 [Candidatus Woesearchaeota archaeon]|nr:hypothetical protein [Candidatus Woesearchaeota archaeon]